MADNGLATFLSTFIIQKVPTKEYFRIERTWYWRGLNALENTSSKFRTSSAVFVRYVNGATICLADRGSVRPVVWIQYPCSEINPFRRPIVAKLLFCPLCHAGVVVKSWYLLLILFCVYKVDHDKNLCPITALRSDVTFATIGRIYVGTKSVGDMRKTTGSSIE